MTASLVIVGPPRTKKTSQRIVRNRKTGKPFVIGSDKTRAWANTATLQLKSQWHREPLSCSVAVKATFYRVRRTGDLTNFAQSLGDVLQGTVIVNDRQIVSWDGSRLEWDKKRPRVEVEISW